MPVFVTPRNSPLQAQDGNDCIGRKEENGPKTGRQPQSSCSPDLSVGSGGTTETSIETPQHSNQENCSRSKDQATILKSSYQDSSDENKQLFMFLNSILLQYLEVLGLHQTMTCFIQEAEDEGHPLPPSLSTAVDKITKTETDEQIRPKDVHQLLKYFDEEDSQPLLEKWKYIRNKCNAENRQEEQRLNVNLRVYVYITIPFRGNYTDDEKQVNIQHLIEEFKAKNHDDCNDPEILSLYAMPFVNNPVQHPVFSKFFTPNWIEKLRKSLIAHCQSLCKRLPNPFDTDLAKLYRLWSNTNGMMHDFSNLDQEWGSCGPSSARNRNSDILRLVPSSVQKVCVFPEDSLFKVFFDSIYATKEENLKMKESDQLIKSEYMEKIQLCDALVTCLKELYMKREDDTGIPWEGIMQKCSQVSVPETNFSEYSFADITDSMMVNAPSSQSDFEGTIEFQRPQQTCGNDFNKLSSRNVPPSMRNNMPSSGRQSLNSTDNQNHHNPSIPSDEPTLRAMRQMLTTIKKPPYEDEGVGDYNRGRATQYQIPLPPPPPPPTSFNRIETNPRHRGLMTDMMQTNNMLRSIVRESEYRKSNE